MECVRRIVVSREDLVGRDIFSIGRTIVDPSLVVHYLQIALSVASNTPSPS